MPWGVQSMSMDVPGLVETSLNLGVAEMSGTEAILRFAIRSSVPSAKELLSCKVQSLTELLGGSVRFHGDYPAWTYARESALRDRCVAVYEAQYGAKPQIVAIHAGLECGILSGKIDGLDCISFGPNLLHVHTPQRARRHCIGGPCVGIPEGYSGLQRVKPSQSQLALCQLPPKGGAFFVLTVKIQKAPPFGGAAERSEAERVSPNT